MTDILNELKAVHRQTGSRATAGGEARTVLLRRDYDAPIEDVWDAITDPPRIARWFLPVTGDLRLGGRYQTEGNAGGQVLACEPPRLLRVSWVMGEDPSLSEVEVRLSAAGAGATRFELEHVAVTDPQRWSEYGPGAVGVGWDLTLLGLGMYLRDGHGPDHQEFESSPEARQFMTESSTAWGDAMRADGATDAEAAIATANTTSFYVPQ